MKLKFFPPFKDEGEVIASWGEARLISTWTGKLNCVGAQIRTGQRRRSGFLCFGMRRWWVVVLGGGVEIVVDVDCQEITVGAIVAREEQQNHQHDNGAAGSGGG